MWAKKGIHLTFAVASIVFFPPTRRIRWSTWSACLHLRKHHCADSSTEIAWLLSHLWHGCVTDRYFPAPSCALYHFPHFTQLLPSLNQHPSWFFCSCFPFSHDATKAPDLPPCSAPLRLASPPLLAVSQDTLPVIDVFSFTGEAFISLVLPWKKKQYRRRNCLETASFAFAFDCTAADTPVCSQVSCVQSTSRNLEESGGYWPLTVPLVLC